MIDEFKEIFKPSPRCIERCNKIAESLILKESDKMFLINMITALIEAERNDAVDKYCDWLKN